MRTRTIHFPTPVQVLYRVDISLALRRFSTHPIGQRASRSRSYFSKLNIAFSLRLFLRSLYRCQSSITLILCCDMALLAPRQSGIKQISLDAVRARKFGRLVSSPLGASDHYLERVLPDHGAECLFRPFDWHLCT